MTYGKHLRRSRHGILYFRFVLPVDVRAHVGRSEVSVSLETASKRDAELRACELRLRVKTYVAALRDAATVTDEEERNRIAALFMNIGRHKWEQAYRELAEADELLAKSQAENEHLKRKLISSIGVPAPSVPLAVAPKLSAAAKAFFVERRSTAGWAAKTEAMWISRLRLLLEWFGDVPVDQLSRQSMVEFFDALKRLPKNASKHAALAGLNFRQLVEVDGYVLISSSTVNLIMECMSSFFAWLNNDRETWKVSGNIAKGLKIAKVESIQRIPFDDDDLRAMLTSPEWKARTFLHSYGYWLLPLGLFTGARINELCQVELRDFQLEDGHPVIRLCPVTLKGKNANARRTVPVHPELTRLGLLRHVERLRGAGATRLFPEIIEKRDGHGQDPSRWFGKFKRRAGILDPRKVFHSTRHGFITQLLDKGKDNSLSIAPMVGHASEGESAETYWNAKAIRRFVEAIDSVVHPTVTEMVPVVEDVKFGVDVHRLGRRPPVRKVGRKVRLGSPISSPPRRGSR